MQAGEKSGEFMPKVNLEKDKSKLKYADLMYMKQAEEVAVYRALRYRKTRNRCTVAGISLACLVVGIYAYTIHAVKQETFLDDLNEPEKIIDPNSKSNLS
ncbi:cytochrome c oxidase assembly factor 3, mitochondrial [Megachile rotundata]|uniref:cytochrome c oxidase assembly factor 3, mitochondrial n=1 Tax=Megachile rotundata TaxID=143995 RepID=UPI000258EA1D|nr:PREDICTED: cytochrome c oxidase assembly factor 3, mitochondrial [Megachile rotundata]